MKKFLECVINCWKKNTDHPPEEPARHSQQRILLEDPPYVEKIEGLKCSHLGKYRTESGLPRGSIVHFTAGRYETKQDAINTLRFMCDNRLGSMIILQDGSIIAPENYDINLVTNHAGPSYWQGHTSLSYYTFPIEVACAGNLDENNHAWWGSPVPEDQVRKMDDKSRWHMFTREQEKTLYRILLWQLVTNPEMKINWIAGHHEVSPGRKPDPGSSLSVSMDQLRLDLSDALSKI